MLTRSKATARRWNTIPYVLLAPGLLWLGLFFVAPLMIMFVMSLREGTLATGFELTWNFGIYPESIADFSEQFIRSFWYAGLATAIALVVAYPLAYAIAFRAGKWKNALLFAVIAPFFTTYLVRTLAWTTILDDASPAADALKFLRIIPEDGRILAVYYFHDDSGNRHIAGTFLAIAAPYAFHEGPGEPAAPIGPYIVEGSRPGAAAASVWLAHRVLPLDDTGYGALIGRTVGMARALHRAIASYRGTRGARLIPLNDPDLNLVTFLAVPPGPPDLERINRFNEALFRRFAVTHERPVYSYEFLLSKTTFDVPRHRASLESRLDEPLWSVVASGSHLTVLRATVMNPFALRPDEPGDFTDLLAALEEAMASEILTETASNPARPSRDPARRR